MWKGRLKHSTAVFKLIHLQFQILAATEYRFIAKQKQKIKNADARVWDDARGDQKPESFCGA